MPVSPNMTSAKVRRKTSVVSSTILDAKITSKLNLVVMMNCEYSVSVEGALRVCENITFRMFFVLSV